MSLNSSKVELYQREYFKIYLKIQNIQKSPSRFEFQFASDHRKPMPITIMFLCYLVSLKKLLIYAYSLKYA